MFSRLVCLSWVDAKQHYQTEVRIGIYGLYLLSLSQFYANSYDSPVTIFDEKMKWKTKFQLWSVR